jgi:hypothetical protein
MTLFVAGGEANSRRAMQNLTHFCEKELESEYELSVIDVFDDFRSAAEQNVMVTPTLIVTHPPPAVTLLGDLRDADRLRAALRIGDGP